MISIVYKNSIAIITLNRPEKRNALNFQMVSELRNALQNIVIQTGMRAVVIKAVGEVFSAGADLASLQQLQTNTFEENLADSKHLMALFQQIYHYPLPVIAALNGHAIAGGCGLATVCDFAFATPAVKMGYTEVKIGFIPAIVSVYLVRKIGEGQARNLLLQGNLIDAEKALQIGLINDIIDADNLENHVLKFTEKLIAQTSGNSLALTKKLLATVQDLAHQEALTYAAIENAHARASADCQKGITAFLNKEKITW